MNHSRRIDFIDGLRAFSILLVIFEHISQTPGFPVGLAKWRPFYAHGKTGVLIFFVISGFLITSLLLKEKDSNKGCLSVKNFYIRRFLRIFPVFYLYLFFAFWANKYFALGAGTKWFLFAATYSFNFVYPCTPILNHLWSLSIEEQFYVFWPWIVKWANNRLYLPAVLIVLLAPFTRVFSYLHPMAKNLVLAPFFNYADSLMIGALTAILLNENSQLPEQRFFSFKSVPIFCFILIWTVTSLSMNEKLGALTVPFGNTVISVCVSIIILSLFRLKDFWLYKLLTFPVILYLGKISYSVYIWQQFFFQGDFTGKPYLYSVFPINLVLVLIVSIASYELWEKSFLRLKTRFATDI